MGYYTRYQLTWGPRKDLDDPVKMFFNTKQPPADNFIEYALAYDGTIYEPASWYGYDDNMIALSKLFPTITFILSGEGEENSDIWKKQYINGNVKVSKTVINFTEFE